MSWKKESASLKRPFSRIRRMMFTTSKRFWIQSTSSMKKLFHCFLEKIESTKSSRKSRRFYLSNQKICLKKQSDVCEIDMNTQTFNCKNETLIICPSFMRKMKSDSNGINEIRNEVKWVAQYSMRYDVLLTLSTIDSVLMRFKSMMNWAIHPNGEESDDIDDWQRMRSSLLQSTIMNQNYQKSSEKLHTIQSTNTTKKRLKNCLQRNTQSDEIDVSRLNIVQTIRKTHSFNDVISERLRTDTHSIS